MAALRNFNGLASWKNAENSLQSVNLTMPPRQPRRALHQQYDRQGPQDRNSRTSRRRLTIPLKGRPPPSHGGGRPLFYAVCIKSQPMAGRFAPPSTVRAYARCRLLVLRKMHRRLSLGHFAPSPYTGAEAPCHRPAIPHCNFIIRIPKPATTDPYASSFGSERIFAFFRHHGPGSLGNFPSRQHALGQKRPQTALRDIDAA